MSSRPLPGPGISSAHAPELDLPARFMAMGMLCLLIAALVFPFVLPSLANGYGAPEVLAFVHLNTLGVVAAVIVGASYQLVPVVLQTPLASPRFGRLSFWVHLTGLSLFLPGLRLSWLPGIGLGATLLFSGLLLYVSLIGRTIARAPHHDVVSWHMAVALVGLCGGVLFGFLLALNEGTGFLGARTGRLLAAHITLMFAGWIAVMLTGVAYRLVGMFTLAEDRLWTRAAWAELLLTTAGAWSLALALVLGAGRVGLIPGALALLLGQALFAAQLAHLYRVRRRRGNDVHIPFALVAAGSGLAAAGLLTIGLVTGVSVGSALWVAVVWLALMGMAETAIQGFLYKIATFLVWLQRYAPLAGRQRVPRLEDLFSRRLARAGWMCWTAGLVLALAGILAGSRFVCLLAGLADGAGLSLFLVNMARIALHWHPIAVDRFRQMRRIWVSGIPQKGKNL